MDKAYQNARNRLAALEAEVKKVQSFLSLYEEFAESDPKSPQLALPIRNNEVSAAPLPQNSRLTITEAAILILRESGGAPVETMDMMERVIAKGVRVSGAKPWISIGSSLSRDKRFKNLRGKGWVLSEDDASEVSASEASGSTSA